MRYLRIVSVVLSLTVAACASSPPVHYLSLDDGRPAPLGSPGGFRVAVTQVNLPDLIDRPQLVVRIAGHRLRIDEQYEWAEPLRRQIPRVIAGYLGGALDSARVVALPIDAQNFDLDFKVMLDVQRFEVIAEERVDIDVVWRVEARDGKSSFGRSVVREVIDTTTDSGDDYANAMTAANRALQSAAKDVASAIVQWGDLKSGAPPRVPVVPESRGTGITHHVQA